MGKSLMIDVWEKVTEKMDDMALCDANEAINRLKKWKDFDDAFAWTGYGAVGQLVLEEIKRRHG